MCKKTDFSLIFMLIALGNLLILNSAFAEENNHNSQAHVHGEANANIAMIGSSM